MKKFVCEEEAKVNAIKQLYEELLSLRAEDTEYMEKLVRRLLCLQNEDGSFAVIDDYRVDADARVDYVFFPTYYGTAALMYYSLVSRNTDKNLQEYFLKGLAFSAEKSLAGHGYSATRKQLDALQIFKKAGLYEWMTDSASQAAGQAEAFSKMVRDIIETYRTAVLTGRTFSDWQVDFREEFEKEVTEYDEAIIPYVWYAAYGSNISGDRFMKYIMNCTDTTEPAESKAYIFPYTIYFAHSSRNWDRMGVAFLDERKPGMSLGRIYKITRSQFTQIQRMEGAAYTKQLYLGMEDGLPVYTFTTPQHFPEMKIPCRRYLDTILKGLEETYPEKSSLVLTAYLFSHAIAKEDTRKVLAFIRSSEHAVTLSQIADDSVCPGITKVRTVIRDLTNLGLIRQDSRSIHAGHSNRDDQAAFYTEKQMRDIIDLLVLNLI